MGKTLSLRQMTLTEREVSHRPSYEEQSMPLNSYVFYGSFSPPNFSSVFWCSRFTVACTTA
jgi:hypothetical protein